LVAATVQRRGSTYEDEYERRAEAIYGANLNTYAANSGRNEVRELFLVLLLFLLLVLVLVLVLERDYWLATDKLNIYYKCCNIMNRTFV
jgi:hypothetical protein